MTTDTTLALFDMAPTDCWECGRPLRNGGCPWCSAPNPAEAGQAAALSTKTAWAATALEWVLRLPAGTVFTSEDVTEAVGLPAGEIGTNMNNAVGAFMAGLRRRDLVELAGYVNSQRRSSHSGLLRQWRRL